MVGIPSVKGLKRFLSELVYFDSNRLPLKLRSLGYSLTAFSYDRVSCILRVDNHCFLSLARVHHWNDHHQYHACRLNDGRNDHNTDRGQNTSPIVGPFSNMSLSGSFRGPYSLCGTKQGLAFNTPNTSQSSRTIKQSTSRNTR